MTGIASAIPLNSETRRKVVKFSVGLRAISFVRVSWHMYSGTTYGKWLGSTWKNSQFTGTRRIRTMSTEKRNAMMVVMRTAMPATMRRSRSSARCWTSESSLSRSDVVARSEERRVGKEGRDRGGGGGQNEG